MGEDGWTELMGKEGREGKEAKTGGKEQGGLGGGRMVGRGEEVREERESGKK